MVTEACSHCSHGITEDDQHCEACDGTGIWVDPDPHACPYGRCNGGGIIEISNHDDTGTIFVACPCDPDAEEDDL